MWDTFLLFWAAPPRPGRADWPRFTRRTRVGWLLADSPLKPVSSRGIVRSHRSMGLSFALQGYRSRRICKERLGVKVNTQKVLNIPRQCDTRGFFFICPSFTARHTIYNCLRDLYFWGDVSNRRKTANKPTLSCDLAIAIFDSLAH